MKKLLFIIMLLPVMAWGQSEDEYAKYLRLKSVSIFVEWQRYLDDCNELVADTIEQSGIVKCELVPVKMNGKIVSYNTVPIDTTWNKCECEKYKNYSNYNLVLGGTVSWNNSLTTSYGNLIGYSEPKPAKNTFSINRNKICHIKKIKASFEDFFERWCVEKKLIEMN